MTVVASDGQEVEPEVVFVTRFLTHFAFFSFEVVTSLTIANGERFDFLLSTEGKEAKSYQMTFAGAEGSWTDCSGLATLAFIQYEDAPVDQAAVPDYAGGTRFFFTYFEIFPPLFLNLFFTKFDPGGLSVPGLHLNPYPSLPLPDQQTEVAVFIRTNFLALFIQPIFPFLFLHRWPLQIFARSRLLSIQGRLITLSTSCLQMRRREPALIW